MRGYNSRVNHARIAVLSLVCILSSCGESPLSGPPPTQLGQDACAECDMTVREDRYSCGAVVRKGEVRSHVSFDDIGCMLDHARFHPELEWVEEYVRDAVTGRWVEASKASYVVSEQVATPMASGISAYAEKADADAAGKKVSAAVQTWPEVRAARQALMESRYGKPETSR